MVKEGCRSRAATENAGRESYVSYLTPSAVGFPAGGGNDVFSIRDDCIKFNDACKYQIDSAMEIAGTLLNRMKTDGVKHVIYLGFYQINRFEQVAEYGSEGVSV